MFNVMSETNVVYEMEVSQPGGRIINPGSTDTSSMRSLANLSYVSSKPLAASGIFHIALRGRERTGNGVLA
jgi:hypothetical protein